MSRVDKVVEAVRELVHPGGMTLPELFREVEYDMFQSSLVAFEGNRTSAARFLGYKRTGLYMKMKAFGMERFPVSRCRCHLTEQQLAAIGMASREAGERPPHEPVCTQGK